jgi:hypothetical protein
VDNVETMSQRCFNFTIVAINPRSGASPLMSHEREVLISQLSLMKEVFEETFWDNIAFVFLSNTEQGLFIFFISLNKIQRHFKKCDISNYIIYFTKFDMDTKIKISAVVLTFFLILMNYHLFPIGLITKSSLIKWVNKIEQELQGQINQRNNLFWLNSNNRNGQIFKFISNTNNGIQKKPNHFFTKSGIPWLGHPTYIPVQSDSNVFISCYIHADTRYPINVVFVKDGTILDQRYT